MMKHMAIIFGVLLSICLSSTAFAAVANQSGGTLTITTPTAACPGPDMLYTPSPSTVMAAFTSDVAYAITAVSSKTDTENGMEYGILSSNEGYFQRAQTTTTVVAPTVATSLPGSNWKDKNGSTPAP